jgi:hypothetical protein
MDGRGKMRRERRYAVVEGEWKVHSRTGCRARRNLCATIVFAAAVLLTVPLGARAQQVVALVNGEPITMLDVEHRSKFMQLSSKKPPQRKDVLDSLINEILEIKEAKRFSIEVPDAEVNKAYATVASRMGIDAQKLTQDLESRVEQPGSRAFQGQSGNSRPRCRSPAPASQAGGKKRGGLRIHHAARHSHRAARLA